MTMFKLFTASRTITSNNPAFVRALNNPLLRPLSSGFVRGTNPAPATGFYRWDSNHAR